MSRCRETSVHDAEFSEINNRIFDIESKYPMGDYRRLLLYRIRCDLGKAQDTCRRYEDEKEDNDNSASE